MIYVYYVKQGTFTDHTGHTYQLNEAVSIAMTRNPNYNVGGGDRDNLEEKSFPQFETIKDLKGYHWDMDTLTFVQNPARYTMPKITWMRRLTAAEQASFLAYDLNGYSQDTQDTLEVTVRFLNLAELVDVTHPVITNALDALVAEGAMTQDRANELVAPV